jgi:hypothetical protein
MLCISSRDSSRESIAFHFGFRMYCCKRHVCRSLEEMLAPQEGPRLTKLLEESHPKAGGGGNFIFMVSLVVMTLVSYMSRVFRLARVVDHAASFLVLLKNGYRFFSANVPSN